MLEEEAMVATSALGPAEGLAIPMTLIWGSPCHSHESGALGIWHGLAHVTTHIHLGPHLSPTPSVKHQVPIRQKLLKCPLTNEWTKERRPIQIGDSYAEIMSD